MIFACNGTKFTIILGLFIFMMISFSCLKITAVVLKQTSLYKRMKEFEEKENVE